MLRVSSLGLKRLHDASFLFLRPYSTAQLSPGHNDTRKRQVARAETTKDERSDKDADSAPTSLDSACSDPSSRAKRTPATKIPPLDLGPRGIVYGDATSYQPSSSTSIVLDAPMHIWDEKTYPLVPHQPESSPSVESIPMNRAYLKRVIAKSASVDDAWEAYQQLLSITRLEDGRSVPFSHLHRLTRLIASARPRTRANFVRLLSVITTIRRNGGQVRLWQWNVLIDFAGKGWRKTRLADFKSAIDVYEDMIAGRHPGASWGVDEDVLPSEVPHQGNRITPDVVTFTTLINIAANTKESSAMRHATALMEAAGVAPNRVTYLALIKYYTRKNQLGDVRLVLARMEEKGSDLDLDGVNAILWAYARAGQLGIASAIYRVLRNWVVPENDLAQDEVTSLVEHLRLTEHIALTQKMLPNAATYHVMIQCSAYHGDLVRCLQVFMDMLSTPERTILRDEGGGSKSTLVAPTLAAFRAIFLGFSRHGQARAAVVLNQGRPVFSHEKRSGWILDNLELLFESFLKLPPQVKPSERIIYWVLVAFTKTSNEDSKKLRWVWEQLEERFGGHWGSRLEQFKRRIFDDR